MKKTSPIILVVGISTTNSTLMHELKKESRKNSASIIFFDESQIDSDGVFSSRYSTHDNLIRKTIPIEDSTASVVFNLDCGKQLANALIQEHERCNQFHSLSFHDNLHANHILWALLQQHLIENRIDTILFLQQPNNLMEHILYQVSQKMKKRTIILKQSIFHNRFFSFQTLEDYGDYEVNTLTIDYDSVRDSSKVDLRNTNHKCVDCQGIRLQSVMKVILFLLKEKSFRLFDPVYIFRRAIHLHDVPELTQDWHDSFAKFLFVSKTAYFEFLTCNFEISSVLKQKFVFFPLQSLEDLYTEVPFNRYSDQLLALEQLAKILPDDIKIVVKHDDGKRIDYLTPMFFHRMRRNSKVIKLPSCVNSAQLLHRCHFLATVNSQIGWEALKIGKITLVFGNPWYWKMPGVCRYQDDLSYEELIKTEVDNFDFEQQLRILHSRLHVGNLNVGDDLHSPSNDSNQNIDMNHVAKTIFDLVFGHLTTTFQNSTPPKRPYDAFFR